MADLVSSASLLPVTVTVAGTGTIAGAVYNPLADMVPQAAPVQPIPDKAHVTALFDVPVTDAASCCVDPVFTEAVAGLKDTTITEVPVPLREIAAVGLIDELLVMVN